QEGLAWFDAVLAEATLDDLDPAVQVMALADRAVLYAWLSVYAVADAEKALAIARDLDDRPLLLRALIACGSSTVYDGEISRRYLEEASDLARALGDRWRLGQILSQQAQIAFVAGDPGALRVAGEEGRDIADGIGDRFGSRQC